MDRQRAAFRIEIEAPDREDGGQIICLFRKVRDLVQMLGGNCLCAREVEIKFKDGEKGKWFIDGEPTATDLGDDETCPHLSILLPFLQLRNLNRLEVGIPEEANLEAYHLQTIQGLEVMIQNATLFDEDGRSDDGSDASTLSIMTKNHFSCEQALVRLKGWTAMMLRLEQFVERYSCRARVSEEFVEQVKRVFKQGTTSREQEYLSWTVQDDLMIRALLADEDSQLLPARFYSDFVRRMGSDRQNTSL